MEREKEAATCEHTLRWGRRKGAPCGAKVIPFSFGWSLCRTHAPWRKKAKEIVESREIMADFGVEEGFWNEEEDIEEWVKEMSKLPEKPDRDPWTEPTPKVETQPPFCAERSERLLSEKRVIYARKMGEMREEWSRPSDESDTDDMRVERRKREVRSGVAAFEGLGRGVRYWAKGKDVSEADWFAEMESNIRNPDWKPSDGCVGIGVTQEFGEGAVSDRDYKWYVSLMEDMSASLSALEEQWTKMAAFLTLNVSGAGSATHEEFHRVRKRSMIKWTVICLHRSDIQPTLKSYKEAKVELEEDGMCEYDKDGSLELCPYGECKCGR